MYGLMSIQTIYQKIWEMNFYDRMTVFYDRMTNYYKNYYEESYVLKKLKTFIYVFYLYVCQMYIYVINMLLKIFGPVYIVHLLKNNEHINLTFYYYCRYLIPNNYTRGEYYCKIVGSEISNHIIHDGSFHELPLIQLPKQHDRIKRKNFLLLNESNPENMDLSVLDNYVQNMIHLKKNDMIDIEKFLKCHGKKCTHVKFTHIRPFKIETIDIQKLKLHDFYDGLVL
jgi:hypothetical protein